MKEIELERTFLAKYIPEGVWNSPKKEILDLYIPASTGHPILRIRKKGDKYEMTKKQPVNGTDSSHQSEDTIILSGEEFEALSLLESKKVRKLRYYFNYEGGTAEVDVFQDELEGLVVIDFEFGEIEDKDFFQAPDFCLADVTQEKFIAGGILCGKKYEDIEGDLTRFGYERIKR